MGLDYIGYQVAVPKDKKLWRDKFEAHLDRIAAALKLAGKPDEFENAPLEKQEAAMKALEDAGAYTEEYDGYDDSAAVLKLFAGWLERAKQFSLEEYQSFRSSGWSTYKINGVEVVFCAAGERSFGDDPGDEGMENTACNLLKALVVTGAVAVIEAAVPWDARKNGGKRK